MKIEILGCGTSSGVPMATGDWGACDPNEPKNRRRRASIMLSFRDGYTMLVDTGTDLREQLISAQYKRIDSVFYTHDHADHTNGIDDIRFIVQRQGREPIKAYSTQDYIDAISKRFDYIFQGSGGYPSLLDAQVITEGENIFGGHRFDVFRQPHGRIQTLGFRVGDFAYCTDCVDLNDSHFAKLKGLDCWVVDAVRYEPHRTHAHLDMVLEWVEIIKPKRVFLTHMTYDMDYQTLCKLLPDHIRPAYDGLIISV